VNNALLLLVDKANLTKRHHSANVPSTYPSVMASHARIDRVK